MSRGHWTATIELYQSINGSPSVLYLTNEEWTLGPTAIFPLKSSFAAVRAFPLLGASHDSSMLVTLLRRLLRTG